MNYTYYNKIKFIYNYDLDNLNEYIDNEIETITKDFENSEWGIIKAANDYLSILEKVKNKNKGLFKKIKIKRLLNNCIFNFDFKIRVLFIVNEYSVFPSVKPVYDEMKKNDNFSCSIVHVDFFHVNKTVSNKEEINDYIKHGYIEIQNGDDFDMIEFSPDVVIYLKPYDNIPSKYYVNEMEKITKHLIYIPYGLTAVADKEIYRYHFQLPLEDKAWINVSQSKHNQLLAEQLSLHKGKNFYMIGHPRMDLINENYENNDFYKTIKEKSKGRKIFLYNPHHSVSTEYKWGTFKIFGMEILKYFKENPNLFLLFRPHPMMKGALEKEYDKGSIFWKEYNDLIYNTPNILYDDTEDYLVAMHIADFLISDANSFIPEFTMYNKPVIYTQYPYSKKIDDKELESMIYTCKNIKQIKNTIIYLANEKDYKKNLRNKIIPNYFCYNKNETVSKRLIKIIEKEFINGEDL